MIMKEIKLSQGEMAIVDDCQYDELMKYKWISFIAPHTTYARGAFKSDGKRKMIFMHRYLLDNICNGMQVDHIDGNGLNNQMSNLRICTQTQNHHNQKLRKDSVSRYKGVAKSGKKYRALIRIEKKLKCLGTFSTAIDAAKEYDRAAKYHFGEFAKVNFPENFNGLITIMNYDIEIFGF